MACKPAVEEKHFPIMENVLLFGWAEIGRIPDYFVLIGKSGSCATINATLRSHLREFSGFRDTSHHATKSHPGCREGFQFVERLLNDWLANLKQPASYCSALAV